jgi:hypothetical protein
LPKCNTRAAEKQHNKNYPDCWAKNHGNFHFVSWQSSQGLRPKK